MFSFNNNTYKTEKSFYVFSIIPKEWGILRRIRQVSEIVYESRGKLIGGSLSRRGESEQSTIRETRAVTVSMLKSDDI